MEDLAADPAELRARGFKALVDALGWANAVRFLRQYEPGVGDYTAERNAILPDWDAATLVHKAKETGNLDGAAARDPQMEAPRLPGPERL